MLDRAVFATREASTKVGFWPSGQEGVVAVQEASDPSFASDPAYSAVLWYVQRPERQTYYKGWSNCRVCGRMNGSADYHRDGYTWPEGYAHYITAHGVRPPQQFIAAAVKAYRRSVK